MSNAAHGMSRSRFYRIMALMLTVAYAWVAYNAYLRAHDAPGISACILHSTTGVPCPGCGTTRSVVYLIHGDVLCALRSNPLGFAVVITLAVVPWWIVVDLVRRRSTLIDAYTTSGRMLRQTPILVGVALLIAGLWIWNIYNLGIGQ